MPNPRSDTGLRSATPLDEAVRAIDGVNRIRFGSNAITLNEGNVVQLAITEKKRL